MTIKAHQDAIALYESEANGGQDARAKHLASSTLPALRRSWNRAKATCYTIIPSGENKWSVQKRATTIATTIAVWSK